MFNSAIFLLSLLVLPATNHFGASPARLPAFIDQAPAGIPREISAATARVQVRTAPTTPRAARDTAASRRTSRASPWWRRLLTFKRVLPPGCSREELTARPRRMPGVGMAVSCIVRDTQLASAVAFILVFCALLGLCFFLGSHLLASWKRIMRQRNAPGQKKRGREEQRRVAGMHEDYLSGSRERIIRKRTALEQKMLELEGQRALVTAHEDFGWALRQAGWEYAFVSDAHPKARVAGDGNRRSACRALNSSERRLEGRIESLGLMIEELNGRLNLLTGGPGPAGEQRADRTHHQPGASLLTITLPRRNAPLHMERDGEHSPPVTGEVRLVIDFLARQTLLAGQTSLLGDTFYGAELSYLYAPLLGIDLLPAGATPSAAATVARGKRWMAKRASEVRRLLGKGVLERGPGGVYPVLLDRAHLHCQLPGMPPLVDYVETVAVPLARALALYRSSHYRAALAVALPVWELEAPLELQDTLLLLLLASLRQRLEPELTADETRILEDARVCLGGQAHRLRGLLEVTEPRLFPAGSGHYTSLEQLLAWMDGVLGPGGDAPASGADWQHAAAAFGRLRRALARLELSDAGEDAGEAAATHIREDPFGETRDRRTEREWDDWVLALTGVLAALEPVRMHVLGQVAQAFPTLTSSPTGTAALEALARSLERRLAEVVASLSLDRTAKARRSEREVRRSVTYELDRALTEALNNAVAAARPSARARIEQLKNDPLVRCALIAGDTSAETVLKRLHDAHMFGDLAAILRALAPECPPAGAPVAPPS